MSRNFLAGVATVDMMVGDRIVATANTLLDSSISIGTSFEDVRGGAGNKLFGKYFHTSTFDITLTDVMFKLEYFAFNTGSAITQIADIFTSEQVVIGATNTGTIVGDAVSYRNYGVVGWVTVPGSDSYETVAITGKTFPYTAPVGTVVCIKYLNNNSSSRQITISSAFIPSEVQLVMNANLYIGGSTTNIVSGSSKAGSIQVVVPRFIFNGTQELSMTSSGVANSPISGSALDNPSADCSEGGYYATITETLTGSKWYDNVVDLAINNSDDITIATAATSTLEVFAVPTSGSAFKPPVGDLTFTSKTTGTATVSAEGVVTGVAAGTTDVVVTITAKQDVGAAAIITVT